MITGGTLPFAFAFGLLFLLAAMQFFGLGEIFGDADADFDFDVDADIDGVGGALDGFWSVLGIGKMPFLMWFSLLLFLFSGIGFTGQLLLDSMAGFMLSPLVAVPAALVAALPLTGALSGALAPILPRDETTAIARASLLGKRGHIDIGTARRDSPARARVRGIHGQTHNVMVEPHDDDAVFETGDEILLVRQDDETFYAISDSDRRLGTVRS